MKNIIKKQLQNIKIAQLPPFDDNTTELYIPKLNHIVIKENSCYLVELSPNIQTNDSLTFNWNNGKKPNYSHYKIDVIKIMGPMIKVNGIAFDINTNQDIYDFFEGWLPIKDIKVLEKI